MTTSMQPNPELPNSQRKEQVPSLKKTLASFRFGYWPILVLLLVVAAGIVIRNSSLLREDQWAEIFEDRSFDIPTQKLAVIELNSMGVAYRINAGGRIEVDPDLKLNVETTLHEKGLRPVKFEEIRSQPESALSILESTAQREQRLRSVKEKELCWLIQRAAAVTQAHVTIEPISANRRFLTQSKLPKYRVRVFLEPVGTATLIDDKTIDKIQTVVLAGLPETSADQITIHDSQNVYTMAGINENQPENSTTDQVENTAQAGRELADQIMKKIGPLNRATVQVRLETVDESSANGQQQQSSPITNLAQEPVLYLNEPVEIPIPESSTPSEGRKSTTRAKVQVAFLEANPKNQSPEFRKAVHQQISALIAPVLLEQLDWQTAAEVLTSGDDRGISAEVSAEKTSDQEKVAKAMQEQPSVNPLEGTKNRGILPMILGICGVVMASGVALSIGSLRNREHSSKRRWIPSSSDAQWAHDNSSAEIPEQGPHLQKRDIQVTSDEIPVQQAADLLGHWISESHETAHKTSS